MKRSILFAVILFLCSKNSIAQLSYNYSMYSVGADGGLARAFADVPKEVNTAAFFVNLSYNYGPYINLTAEVQAGKLAGGDTKTDTHTRSFVNGFKAIVLYADFQAGEFIDYQNRAFLSVIKDFYVGTGFGVIHNNMLSIQRVSLNDPNYIFPGQNSSTEITLPVRFGYEFKFYNEYQEPYVKLDLGYQMNWVYGEGLDGYDDPPSKFRNDHVDRYGQLLICVKRSFGNPVSYKKPIRGFY